MPSLLSFLLLTMLALPAGAALIIDPTRSTLTPGVGSAQTLSGTLTVVPGDPLPLSSTTTFDVVALDAMASGGMSITLDPSLSRPGAGVLNPSGDFLIPALFLALDDGAPFQLTVPSVTGSYGAIAGCKQAACLETSFAVDTGGPSGIVTVHLYAIPEPGTAALVAAGLAALSLRRTRRCR